MGKFPKKDEEKGGILHLPKKRRGKMGEFSIYPEKDEEKKQKQLHRQLGEFADWMKQEKDTSEIQKDQRKSVPIKKLPMVF